MALNRIDIAGFKSVMEGAGDRPEIGFVALADLVVDDRYQRRIEAQGRRNIQRIAENFDWNKFTPLIVSRRETGDFAIIDGQHRAHAAALCGASHVPALIARMTLQQEAAAFSWVNGAITALTQNQIFKAALAAFEPWAVQCDAVVSRAGCRLMPYNASSMSRKAGEVFCVGFVRRAVAAGHSEQLSAVLAGVKASTQANDPHHYGGLVLSSMLEASIQAGATEPRAIAGFLDAHDLAGIEDTVRSLHKLPEHRGGSRKALFVRSIAALLKVHLAKEARAA